MSVPFLTTSLLVVSALTNLTVEGLKKLLNGTSIKYSSNVLAASTSVVLSGVVSTVYMIMTNTDFTTKVGVEIAILMYLSFLVSTVGYDKVVQMINQVKNNVKDDVE